MNWGQGVRIPHLSAQAPVRIPSWHSVPLTATSGNIMLSAWFFDPGPPEGCWRCPHCNGDSHYPLGLDGKAWEKYDMRIQCEHCGELKPAEDDK